MYIVKEMIFALSSHFQSSRGWENDGGPTLAENT